MLIIFLSLFYFRKNILLLLLYPKHVIKLLGHNLRCYNDCIIDYHPGKSNVVVDALSRKEMTTLLIQCNEWRKVSDGAILAQLKVQPILKQMIIDA